MQQALQDRMRFGPFVLDPRAGELYHHGRKILLHDQQLQILLILLEHKGEIATREEIKHKLWPNDTVVEFDHSINNNIKNLRRLLGDSAQNPGYIETIASRGYRLMVPVERTAGESVLSTEEPRAGQNPATPTARLTVGHLTGKLVSHYRVMELIGGGGMGLVYRAEDVKLGRSVALKFLPEEVADDPKALERFEREARAASALDNPHICTIHEFGEHQGQPFIVMEMLEGKTLRDQLASAALNQRPLPLEELLAIADQICDALNCAHQKGIIHRDIKPANIFLTTSGQAKILDFGLAKLTKALGESAAVQPQETAPIDIGLSMAKPGTDTTATSAGVAIGSEGYMSPEQVRGEKLDARTDIFSFGLVLYEMAAGQRAFAGETSPMVRDAILTDAPRPLRELNSAVPAKLVNVIDKALEKDRDHRWQNTAAMRAALGRVRRGRFSLFRRLFWTVTSALLLIGLGTAG